MWRLGVLTVVTAALLAPPACASLFLERPAGGSDVDYDSLLKAQEQQRLEDELREFYEQQMAEEEMAMAQENAYEKELAQIIAHLAQKQEEEEPESIETAQAPTAPKQDQKAPAAKQAETPVEKPQKKGQSEYVSFVEPPEVVAYRQRDVQSLEKRRLAQAIHGNSYSPRGDTNLAMMAVGCVLVVGVVGGAVGGIYYKRRKESPEDNEYAPYAGTGPFKRGKHGDKGDDALAYKAQLHHYQQAKQKIICGDDAPGVGLDSEDEECPDDENNYSVYECPGLAPTGDIEIHNPNFGQ